MKKKLLSLLLILVISFSLIPSAYAWQTDEGDYIGADITFDEAYAIAKDTLDGDAGKDLAQIASEHAAIVWHYNPYGEDRIPEPVLKLEENDTFDSLVEKLFSKYDVYSDISNEYYSHISLGYLNLVTGEEHYYGDDHSIVAASLFKVPENMIFCDRISNGELTYDTEIGGEPYKFHQYRTLSRSDNDRAFTLYSYLGGYIEFKKQERAYIGDPPYAEGEFIDGGDVMYTPREVIYALKTVYGDQEKYNGILQNMLQANPYEYFKMFQRDYVVAQKYGFLSQDEPTGTHSYINCCGIVFAEQPVAIVCMTDNIGKAYDVIGEYSCLASQLSEIETARSKAELEAKEEEARQQIEQTAQEVQEAPKPVELQEQELISRTEEKSEKTKDNKMSLLSCIVIGLILIVGLYFLVILFRRNGAQSVKGVWMALAIIFATLAMVLCVVATQIGTLYAKPSGDPGETVSEFFTAIKNKDYQHAYSCLEDYSDLGLSNEASSDEARKLQSALYDSFDYALKGVAEVDRLTAKQNMMLRYLDLNALEESAKGFVNEALKGIVAARSNDELYDENHQYRKEITDEVYRKALDMALANVENYYRTVEMTVDLDYVNGTWMMATNAELLSYLMGGVSA